MARSNASASPAPVETTEAPADQSNLQGQLTDEQWKTMRQITETILRYRDTEGHDPSKVFHKRPNKRAVPDYYDVIKEPVALSTLKKKLSDKTYTSFEEYVRDVALITHNAQTYNRPEAGAYQDALTLRGLFEEEFKQRVNDGIITTKQAEYPDLGELPPVEELPPVVEEEEEEEDDEDEDEDEEEDETDDEGGKRKRKRGPRSTAATTKREGGRKGDGDHKGDGDSRKRRGRPPKVDTPMEARIKNILKGIRKFKNEDGQVMVHSFEKLPDKAELPDYYIEIKEPLAIEQIKRKQKRKKYQSVDHFLRDMDVMFNNCKSYNMEDSQVYKDAVALQMETHKLAEEEKAKPDTEYALEEGRLPLPNGILHNGEIWKIGDWIHIQNPNDVTKPIVAQVYRTWQDTDGEKWINACWYYRPEQTVHHFEKHFFPNEVVKTGQYRDHRIDEIIDRCFVMFTTRYSRGRPRGLSPNKEVYVCDSRYNEEKHKLNKIKTWASCLPDEVRDKDYEMDLFDHVKKVKKVPSPLLHLLKEDAKDSDETPKPRWGAENAPPIAGAVYKGSRDENQSPPPEPTPSPPPQPPPPAPKPATNMSSFNAPDYHRADAATQGANASHVNHATSYGSSQIAQYPQSSASPAPVHHPHQYAQQPQHNYTHPAETYHAPQQTRFTPQPQRSTATVAPNTGTAYPRPAEVFHLPPNANQAIPPEIRDRYQQDDQGNVLFFAAPPLDILPPAKPGSAVAHSARYLAAKLRAKIAAKEKRKAAGLPEEEDPSESRAKRAKHDGSAPTDLAQQIQLAQVGALKLLNEQMSRATDRIYQDLYGEHWEMGKLIELEKLQKMQADERKLREDVAKNEAARIAKEKVDLGLY